MFPHSTRIALSFLALSALWIAASDSLFPTLFPNHYVTISLYKGWGFVALTAVLLKFWLSAEEKRRDEIENKLQKSAVTDFLTGLHNRFALAEIAKTWGQPNSRPFVLLFVDLDNFKNINTTFGHGYGDILLVEAARRLQTFAPTSAKVVRYGGDEFAIFIPSEDIVSLDAVGAGIIETLSKPYLVSGMRLHIGASVGISLFPQDGMLLEQLMISADLAMRSAKRKRNSYELYNQQLQDAMRKKLSIEHHLRRALEGDEIYMAFQPQITQGGRVCGAEALVRWNNPDLGLVPPCQFIGVAEESGLIAQIGQFIIRQSCAGFRRMFDACGDRAAGLSLSINISVKQFLNKDFKDQLLICIAENGLRPEQVTIEITESLFIEESAVVLPLLQEIRASGVGVSLDDFGTGYSSLSTLRTLPINELKIDKSFIANICNVDQDRKMSQAIIDIGHSMSLKVVAEGIENEEQKNLLDSLGCDVYQGYYFAHPLGLDDFIAFMKNPPEEINR